MDTLNFSDMGAPEEQNLFGTSNFVRESPLEDKKCPQFLTSRQRVTDLFPRDVNHNKQTGCTRLYKVRKRGLQGAKAEGSEGTVEQQDLFNSAVRT